MNECKLVYKGAALNNKSIFLRDIMDSSVTNEVTVTSKSEIEAYADQVGSIIQLFQQYPAYFAGGLVVIIFIVLFIMGGGG
jgi:hypothetical protein